MNIVTNEDVPVAYIEIEPDRKPGDSKRQEIIDISQIGFVPRELIFDIGGEGQILGVEIL